MARRVGADSATPGAPRSARVPGSRLRISGEGSPYRAPPKTHRAVSGRSESSPSISRWSNDSEHVAARYDTSPGAVAVARVLRNPAVDGVIVGFRRPAQVDPILSAADLYLTEQDLTDIKGDCR
jgi:aryl-alcohol dehydrogenase-like predicted oxidoreductase